MNVLSREQQLALAAEANRAPSAHNTQQARWRFLPNGSVRLYEDLSGRLTIEDPTGRDALVGLGAAFEGMHIALTARGLGLSDAEPPTSDDAPAGLFRVADAALRHVDQPDEFADVVKLRHTYRGKFKQVATALPRLRKLLDNMPDIAPVYEANVIPAIARLHDDCSIEFLKRMDYQSELREWIRFSPKDVRWARDGLTAECLGLSRIERRFARVLLTPYIFHVLAHCGLGRPLTSEAPMVRSSTAIAVLHAGPGGWALDSGRRFYKFLLELCRAGFSACPMSALVDSERGTQWLRETLHIAGDRRLVNVFRIGPAPPIQQCTSPRRPPEELLV